MTVLLVWDSYCYFSVKDIKRGLLSPVTTQWASALQIHQTTFLLLLFCHKNAISYVYNTYDSILSYCSFPIMIWIMIWILIMNPKMPSHEATEVYVCCQLYFPLIDLRLFLESHLINTRLELHFFLELTHCSSLIKASNVHLIEFLCSYKFLERNRFFILFTAVLDSVLDTVYC